MGRALTAHLCGRRPRPASGAWVQANIGHRQLPAKCSLGALLPNVFEPKERGLVDGRWSEDRPTRVRTACNQLLRLGDHARGSSIRPHQGGRWPSAACGSHRFSSDRSSQNRHAFFHPFHCTVPGPNLTKRMSVNPDRLCSWRPPHESVGDCAEGPGRGLHCANESPAALSWLLAAFSCSTTAPFRLRNSPPAVSAANHLRNH